MVIEFNYMVVLRIVDGWVSITLNTKFEQLSRRVGNSGI